jgi:hypothetical protein
MAQGLVVLLSMLVLWVGRRAYGECGFLYL